MTGDGDSLSIGGNHLIHALRRNVPVKILLFNNQIYGLTKGQASPTSEIGKVTKSTPFGVADHPFNPVSLALGAEATFVARTLDRDRVHMTEVLRAAAVHEGAALVEIYQNCPVFNDGAFFALTEKETRDANQIRLVAGEPIRFGVDGERGVARGADGGLSIVRRRRRGRGRLDRPRPDPGRSGACVLAGAAGQRPDRADADRDLPQRLAARVRARRGGGRRGPGERRAARRAAAQPGHLDDRLNHRLWERNRRWTPESLPRTEQARPNREMCRS